MYKNFKKLLFVSIFLFIFSIMFFNNRELAQASDGEECHPTTVELCSICGEDYSTCPHHIDEVYNQITCKPTECYFCNICGQNFTNCPHEYGAIYGGVECTTYDRCNVCGGDYTTCEHHRGEAYGGDVCYTYKGYICNICGNNFYGNDCPHSDGECYDDEECSPEVIEICSICWNNYIGCPHEKGKIYNEIICDTTEICNICGGDYSSCPHRKKTIYGGTTCSSYLVRICNICGHDYENADLCPHKQDHDYGGEVCTTTVYRKCNICGNNYDDIRVCYHVSKNYYTNDEKDNFTWDDYVRLRRNGTPLYILFCLITKNNLYPDAFDLAGFEMDENSVYHARQDALQQYGGYTDLYDMIFDLGTSMDKRKFPFIVNGQERVIWLWKGDYLNLGAGAEVGIYYGGEPLWTCGTQYTMPMTLTMVDHSDNVIFDWKPDCNNWWCTGFNPAYQNMDEEDLTVYGSLDFSRNLDMWNAFYLVYDNNSTWRFDEQQHIAYFKW